jgi:hypothetical protein
MSLTELYSLVTDAMDDERPIGIAESTHVLCHGNNSHNGLLIEPHRIKMHKKGSRKAKKKVPSAKISRKPDHVGKTSSTAKEVGDGGFSSDLEECPFFQEGQSDEEQPLFDFEQEIGSLLVRSGETFVVYATIPGVVLSCKCANYMSPL